MKTQVRSRFFVPKSILISYLLAAFSFVFFLFYIDEGYYSVEWTAHPVAWIIFSFYFFPFLLILLFIDAYTFRSMQGLGKAIMTIYLFLLLISGIVFSFWFG